MSNRARRAIHLTLFILLLAILPTIAGAKIIYVDDDAAGANDGSSWEDAYTFLQEALTDANSAEKPVEIRVAQGIYRPNEGLVAIPEFDWRTTTFQLINGVTLKGGYAGLNAQDPNAREIESYETILSGDLNDDDEANFTNNSENSYHVVTCSGTDGTAVLDGFTITGGNADGPSFYNQGGGMYNYSGKPTLMNCTFRANSAHRGGGVFNEQGNSMITNCSFSLNQAVFGGGMSNLRESSPMLTNCIFIGNSADQGAGMKNFIECSPKLTNCTFSGNHAFSRGGGLCNQGECNPTLTNCKIIGNTAGGVVWGNGGGMFNRDGCNPMLINCIIAGNWTKEGYGGGISNWNFRPNGSLTLINCTFARNSAGEGNALACYSEGRSFPTTLQVTNCIIWDGGNEIWNDDNSMIIISFSDVYILRGGQLGIPDDNINEDPCFVELGYWDVNGVWAGDYHLKSQAGRWDPVSESWVVDDATSPCIDAGDPNSPVGDEPEPNGGIINMGAYGGTAEASKSPFDAGQVVYIQWLGHSTVKVWTEDCIVYVDPERVPEALHDADLVCVTHTHGDHYSPPDIAKVSNSQTQFIGPPDVVQRYGSGQTIAPGQTIEFDFINVKAVPSYNTNKPNHPRSNNWVGYVLELGGRRIYVAGDTDLIEEMRSLGKIDVAFLPAGGTYTMNAVEAAEATQYIKPKLAIPYHWGQNVGTLADAQRFADLARRAVKILAADEVIGSDEWPEYQPLLAHWALDESEGGIAYDSAGESPGVLYGDPVWLPAGGKVDGALQFDGVDDYIGAPFVLNPAEGVLSVFAWMKGGAPGHVILSQQDGTGMGQTWLGADSVQGNFVSGLVPPPAGRTVTPALESSFLITDGQWHQVGFVWDGQRRHLYADGVEVAVDVDTINPLTASDGDMIIGAGKSLEAGSFFSGLIDEVRIYDNALDDEEVEVLAQ